MYNVELIKLEDESYVVIDHDAKGPESYQVFYNRKEAYELLKFLEKKKSETAIKKEKKVYMDEYDQLLILFEDYLNNYRE